MYDKFHERKPKKFRIICLCLFQFMQINNLNQKVNDLEYQVSDLDNKISNIKGKDYDYEIDKIKERVTTTEGNIEDLEESMGKAEKTLRNHELSILDLESKLLYKY